MTEHRHGGHGNRHHGQRRRSGKSRNMPRIAEPPVAVLIGMPGAGKTRVGGEVAQVPDAVAQFAQSAHLLFLLPSVSG